MPYILPKARFFSEIQAELDKLKCDKARVEIVDCADVIGMNDNPVEALFYHKALKNTII